MLSFSNSNLESFSHDTTCLWLFNQHSECLSQMKIYRWECLKELLVGDWTDGILCSFGMPIIKGVERYNCQVFCLNRKIVMIRPKMWLANGTSCAELRWFTTWKQKQPPLDEFLIPSDISEALCQTSVPFGYGYIQFLDTYVILIRYNVFHASQCMHNVSLRSENYAGLLQGKFAWNCLALCRHTRNLR